jgi:hypothetical protein
MQTTQHVYVIGDIHGQLQKLIKLLRDAHLIDASHRWCGEEATLWFMGDLVDRGPDGIAVINLVMRLQQEAAQAGGNVSSLLGNHEMLLLAAYRFGRRSTGLGSNFITRWKQNGGNRKDIASLTSHHLEWMAQLPAMALVEDSLLLHADAPLYLKFGSTLDEVNTNVHDLLRHSDALAWEELLEDFARRGVFLSSIYGLEFAARYLKQFGGKRLVHGHTPINTMQNCSPKKVHAPWIYADDLCVNVDGGLFLGGAGFIYQLPSPTIANNAFDTIQTLSL